MPTALPLNSGLTNEETASFAEKLAALTRTLHLQFAESARLGTAIRDNLSRLGFAEWDSA